MSYPKDPVNDDIVAFSTQFGEKFRFYWMEGTTPGVKDVVYCKVDDREPVAVLVAGAVKTAPNAFSANGVFNAWCDLMTAIICVRVYDYSVTPTASTDLVGWERGTSWELYDAELWGLS